MSQTLPWIIATSVLALLVIGVLLRQWLHLRAAEPAPLPAEWALTARPVFSNDERRVYRLLREALPHHIVLSKLPLVRFCQPSDPTSVRYWYDRSAVTTSPSPFAAPMAACWLRSTWTTSAATRAA
jgi:hypothetical protein